MADTISSELPAWLVQKTFLNSNAVSQELQAGLQYAQQQREAANRDKALALQQQAFQLKYDAQMHQAEGTTALASVMSKATAAGKWDAPETEAALWEIAGKYPWVTQDESFTAAQKNIAESRRAKREADNIRLKSEYERTPSDVLKTDYVNQFYKLAKEFEASGNKDKAAEYQRAATLLEGTMLAPKETIESFVDEQGNPSFRITRGGEPSSPATPTKTFQTDLQKQLHSYDNSMALLSHAEANMNASDFGFRGMMKDLGAKIGPQFGLPSNPSDLDVRNSLKLLRQDLYKSIRSDSNITKAEQEQIAGMLPKVEMFDVIESLPDAMGKLLTVKRVLKDKARNAAAKLGVPPPPWTMSGKEVRDQMEAGKISFKEATDLIQMYNLELK